MWINTSVATVLLGLTQYIAGQNISADQYYQVGQDYVNFLTQAVPSPFHAVEEASKRLKAQGFKRLNEQKDWEKEIQANGKYYIVRNGASLVAFAVGGNYKPGNGFTIAGTHTDSPQLKLKPNWSKTKDGFTTAGVETYGGGIWHTWIDRNLGLAGKVIIQDGNKYKTKLININKPALYIPGLPVELNTVNAKTTFIKLNKETNLVPVIGLSNAGNGKADGAKLLWGQIAAQAGVPADKISGFELSAYDLQKPALGGFRNEFVLSGRQDNLMMTYGAIEGLLHSLTDDSLKADPNVRVASIFDHEEVGSSSRHGAGSTLLPNVISRVLSSQSDSKKDPTLYDQGIAKSFLVSADQGHAQHPNYPTKIESNNAPVLNEGPTLKVHLGQRYSTNAHTALVLQLAAKAANVTIQTFLNRNDGSPGSTIGPILSTLSGIPTVDIGNSQFSMHSAREISGTLDVLKARELFTSYFRNFPQITAQLDSNIDE